MPRYRDDRVVLDSRTASSINPDGTGEWSFQEPVPGDLRNLSGRRPAPQMQRGKRIKTYAGYSRGVPRKSHAPRNDSSDDENSDESDAQGIPFMSVDGQDDVFSDHDDDDDDDDDDEHAGDEQVSVDVMMRSDWTTRSTNYTPVEPCPLPV